MKYATAYGIALVLFLIADALWLGMVARTFYTSRIGEIMLDQPRWGVAALFYAVYVLGIVYFGVMAGWQAASWSLAAMNGALFGFFAYLTYNFTNLSVIRGYDGTVAVVDTLWGALVSAVVAGGTVAILNALGRTPN